MEKTEVRVFLKPGREKSLKRRHVWIFSGAIDRVEGEPSRGSTVEIFGADGKFLGRGAWSPDSQLRIRIWTFDQNEAVDEAFFARRITRAVELRKFLQLDDPKGGCRLIHSEADGIPGLTADRYGDFLCVQFSSAGAEFFRETLVKQLVALTGVKGIYERSDLGIRSKEGLQEKTGLVWGEQPPNPIIIVEDELRYAVDLRHGQKTGFYFDQRESRRMLRKFAEGKDILNTFSYTGAFAVTALAAGAKHVLNIDSSAPALAQGSHNLEMNHIAPDRFANSCADVFAELRRLAEEKRKFDLVILDPPKFIESQSALTRGCRAYQDIARLGFSLLNPGGLLFNFSCSGLMNSELLQKITADAALEAGVEAVLLHKLEQAPDHPVALSVPEGSYLKGFVSRIME